MISMTNESFSILQMVTLKEGNDIRGMFIKIPFALDFKVYIFNVTNPMEVQKGKQPSVHEVGPFCYQEWKEKVYVRDIENEDIMLYNPKDTYIKQMWPGCLSGEEVVTIPHPMILGLVNAVTRQKPGALSLLNKAIKSIYSNPESIFLTATANQILFDGVEIHCGVKDFAGKAICSQLKAEPSLRQINEDDIAFALLAPKNATPGKQFKVLRGVKSYKDVGRIIEYDGNAEIDTWPTEECNQIKGTDGTIFPPLLTKEEGLVSFAPDLCSCQDSLEFPTIATELGSAEPDFTQTVTTGLKTGSSRERAPDDLTGRIQYHSLMEILQTQESTALRCSSPTALKTNSVGVGAGTNREERFSPHLLCGWSAARRAPRTSSGVIGVLMCCTEVLDHSGSLNHHLIHQMISGSRIVTQVLWSEDAMLWVHFTPQNMHPGHVSSPGGFTAFHCRRSSLNPSVHSKRPCNSRTSSKGQTVPLGPTTLPLTPIRMGSLVGGLFFGQKEQDLSLRAFHVKDTKYDGIPVGEYTANLGDMSKNQDEKCYCLTPETCLKKGVMDLYKCAGVPIYASLPHFYESDLSYVNGVKGLFPEKEKHQIIILFESTTGGPVYAKKRLQFSMPLETNPKVDLFHNFTETVLPMFWVEEGVELNNTFTKPLKDLFKIKKIVKISSYLIIIGSVGGLMIACHMYFKGSGEADITTVHKVQPIDFRVWEGGLGVKNAISTINGTSTRGDVNPGMTPNDKNRMIKN
ncbi:hypothetical protein NQ317_014681 [Molorchus minor]|uniref:Sensory neuron membrane protein 1 n=1 Tax=Molorchus minor TaxID=1323400 RepID=A0ABQ9J2Z1_9CUCU|nr:hypothetical protein NQ317_014681 [Molorchus minor]